MMKCIYSVRVTDLETKHVEVYDYSNQNWANRYACMRNGLVHMWCPNEVHYGGCIITSGRRWELIKNA